MTIIALSYILRGYHVPVNFYPITFAGSIILGCLVWLLLRNSHDQAARFTDKHFNLKDSVRSFEGFHKAGRHAGFYELQAEQTETSISNLSTKTIRYKCPTCIIGIAIVLLLSSVLMGFKGDSPEVLLKMQQEQYLLDTTNSINEQIKEIIEQVNQEFQEKELKDIVDFNDIREKVEKLEEKPDLKEAMRQYAQLEKDLSSMLSKLMQRKEEQLLERMGKELQKDDTSKALGNKLTQKDYESAAKEMEKFEFDPNQAKEIQKSQLEKLQAMAARMSQEAMRTQSGTGQQSNSSQNQASSGQNTSGSRMSQMAQQLNQSAQELSEAMQQSQNQNSQNQNSQQCSGQMQQAAQNANQNLGNIGQYLQQLAAKRQAQSMMENMMSSLAQCQGGLCNNPGQNAMSGNGQNPGNGPNQGGVQAGFGSSNATNTEPGKDAPPGEITQVQGTHGSGTSMFSTEESSSGSGSADSALVRDELEYMRQVESFVRREDVPEAVKAGVKAYFENIHNTDEGN